MFIKSFVALAIFCSTAAIAVVIPSLQSAGLGRNIVGVGEIVDAEPLAKGLKNAADNVAAASGNAGMALNGVVSAAGNLVTASLQNAADELQAYPTPWAIPMTRRL